MDAKIYSRKAIEKLLLKEIPNNVAIINFYDPRAKRTDQKYKPVDYSDITNRVFQVAIHNIDREILGDYNLTYETYFPEVGELAKFIHAAKNDGLDIICQCQYGQSRSATCAAAILEHFYKTGISVFADYGYYPNQMVYHKVFDALEDVSKNKEI